MALEREEDNFESRINPVRLSTISVSINNYEDIFSVFDPRPFSQRGLSEDFLDEMRRAARDKSSGEMEIRIMVPESKRHATQENLIKHRIKEHSLKHYHRILDEVKKIKRRGVLLAVLGVLCIVSAGLLETVQSNAFWMHLLILLLEPGGWFLGWTGLDQFFYAVRAQMPELEFYKRMDNAIIKFVSY